MHATISPAVEERDESIHLTHASAHVEGAPAVHSVWRTSILFTLVTAILLGIGYPLLVTGLASVMFPHKAAGSLVMKDGQVIGSELLAQSFTADKYFHPRPSAAGSG